MSAPATNWEDILKASRFDLPQAKWDAMEARLRERIREERTTASILESRPTLADRFRNALEALEDLFAPPQVRWAGAGALGLVLVGIGLWLRPEAPAVAVADTSLRWVAGQTLQAVGRKEWDWTSGRSHITLRDGAMHLQSDSAGRIEIQVASGTASFQVDHRKPEESFRVGFGSCHIEVVGTAFTITVDSATASASVQEGRVRFLGEGRDQLLDAGQELSCTRPVGGAGSDDTAIPEAIAPAAPPSVAKRPVAVAVAAAPSAADIAFARIEQLCKAQGPSCTEARADFVRRFPNDSRSAELGWAWGESAKAAGDFRDALFAWDVASRSTKRIGLRATIATVELRLGPLPDASRASGDLDRILPKLDVGSTLWVRAWTLRREAARILGEASVLKRADSLLAVPRSASGGP